MAIIGALSISKVFANTKYNGHGTLISATKEELERPKIKLDAQRIGVGMLFAFTLLMVGCLLNNFFPKVHEYAFMIIIVFIIKATNTVPKQLEESVIMFNEVVMTNLTHAVLADRFGLDRLKNLGFSLDLAICHPLLNKCCCHGTGELVPR